MSKIIESIHEHKVIDNKNITMVNALEQLIPHGKHLSLAVGYFYLSGYELIRDTLNTFGSQYKIRVIMGNRTDQRTAYEIKEGMAQYYTFKEAINSIDNLSPTEAIEQEIKISKDITEKAHMAYELRDLITYGNLSIKVYIGASDYFHGKVYLIGRTDPFDGYAIVGSSNFSKGGFTGNSELNVLTKDSFPDLQKWFDALWNSDEVVDFDNKLIDIIETNVIKPKNYISPIKNTGNDSGELKIPHYLQIRDYQKEAIKIWFKNQGKGILEMATGTGKTITSLIVAVKLFEQLHRLAIIIVCPYKHLVTQWAEECKNFNLNPILGFQSRELWEDDLNSKITSYNIGAINCFSLITTNSTFSSETMQKLLKKLKKEALIIVDEAHHLGAAKLRDSLLDNVEFRLGLSATPDRWYDEEGTKALNTFFENGVIFKFGLKDAIGTFLTEYYYYPHIVYLTDREGEEYLEITKKISKCIRHDKDLDLKGNEILQALLIKRARLLSKAENKLQKLKELMVTRKDSKYNIFYCGDTSVDGERQIDRVIQLLGREMGMMVHPFTSDENSQQRKDLLKQFEDGSLQGLVAIRCLDEGVDIPATQNAYILASSTNPREFIQRRGRILRKFPGKQYSFIHDFIVVPRDLTEVSLIDPEVFNIERKILLRELKRFKEFADLAVNGPQARLNILEVAKGYNLLDI